MNPSQPQIQPQIQTQPWYDKNINFIRDNVKKDNAFRLSFIAFIFFLAGSPLLLFALYNSGPIFRPVFIPASIVLVLLNCQSILQIYQSYCLVNGNCIGYANYGAICHLIASIIFVTVTLLFAIYANKIHHKYF